MLMDIVATGDEKAHMRNEFPKRVKSVLGQKLPQMHWHSYMLLPHFPESNIIIPPSNRVAAVLLFCVLSMAIVPSVTTPSEGIDMKLEI